jgi:DNA (cytosine-5)-methyltransferase 1
LLDQLLQHPDGLTVIASLIISLYTGAGGLDYGFEAAGFDTAVAVEMNHESCETLRANRRWAVIERDILQVSSTRS